MSYKSSLMLAAVAVAALSLSPMASHAADIGTAAGADTSVSTDMDTSLDSGVNVGAGTRINGGIHTGSNTATSTSDTSVDTNVNARTDAELNNVDNEKAFSGKGKKKGLFKRLENDDDENRHDRRR